MKTRFSKPIAIGLDIMSEALFSYALIYDSQLKGYNLVPKPIAMGIDSSLLLLQTGETMSEDCSNEFRIKSRRSRGWYWMKTRGIPLAIGAIAAYESFGVNPKYVPTFNSNFASIIGLALQWAKTEILYRNFE